MKSTRLLLIPLFLAGLALTGCEPDKEVVNMSEAAQKEANRHAEEMARIQKGQTSTTDSEALASDPMSDTGGGQ